MRHLIAGAAIFLWISLSALCLPPPPREDEIEARQLGPLGLSILGAITLPLLIPAGVARLVGRLTNLGNSTSSTGVTIRPVILPGRPLRLPSYRMQIWRRNVRGKNYL